MGLTQYVNVYINITIYIYAEKVIGKGGRGA